MKSHLLIDRCQYSDVYFIDPYMYCDLAGSVRSIGRIDVRYSQKEKLISVVFYCSENPSITHNLGTTGPIQEGFLAKCTSPIEDFNQIEN